MLNELDAMCVRERYANLLRAAEHERIIAEVRAQHWEQIGLYRRALLRLGMLLVAAGEHLQLASTSPTALRSRAWYGRQSINNTR